MALTQLLFIETFVLGATSIAAIYHFVLFIQQRDKFLLYYSLHLFSLASYIIFKLVSNNYNPFIPTDNFWYYIAEESLQGLMVTMYVIFTAQTLEVVSNKSITRTFLYLFFIFSALFYGYHLYDAFVHGAGVKSLQEYMISRFSLVGVATVALLLVWRIRTTIFQRTIIIGSFVYDAAWLVSIILISAQSNFWGLSGLELYLLGCLLDIIIFSSALGYRLKTIANQKNELLKKETEARLAVEKTRMRIAIDLHDDVGSVLSSMSVYGEAAKRALKENNVSKAEELIEKIGINARETMENMSDIVWTINPINDNGEKLFNKMEAFASSVLAAKNIDFTFEVDKELYQMDFLMPVRQSLFFIFKEVIANCVKHSNATKVEAIFKQANGKLLIEISDNGKGFDVTNVKNGNGLENIRQRAKEAKMNLMVKSDNIGTKLFLSLTLYNLS